MTDADHQRFMRKAIAMARQSAILDRTGSPFGCLIVRDGEVVGAGVNQVLANQDPTSHGEIVAIRDACRRLGTHDLSGSIVYTSCEPCPMCYAAAWWARVDAVYYASTIQDALDFGDFDDKPIYDAIAQPGPDRAVPARELLRDEMVEVWKEFHAIPGHIHY
ncbi:MAG: nucleoside deaminase [Chloroflexota bacterium]